MKLLPVDIRNKNFGKSILGGYKPSEVKEFLSKVSEQYVHISVHNTELENRLEDAQAELIRVREMERALLDALKGAEKQRDAIIDQSKKEAEVRIMEGEVAAKALVNTAKERAQNMLHQVQNECENKMRKMQQEFELLDVSYKEVEAHVDSLIAQMQIFVDETNSKIAHLANLKNRKAIGAKLASAKDLLEAHETEERLREAENRVNKPYDIESPVMPKAQQTSKKTKPVADIHEKTQAPPPTTQKAEAQTSQKGLKPRTIHETLAQKGLGHLPDDSIDMSNFFDPIGE